MLYVVGAVLPVLFVTGWTGAASAPRWALLFVTIPIIWLFAKKQVLNIGHYSVFGLVGAAWISQIFTSAPYDGLLAAMQLSFLALLTAIELTEKQFQRLCCCVAGGICVSSAIAIGQKYQIPWLAYPFGYIVAQVAPPAGLFINRNVLAEAAGLLLIPMLAYKRWILAFCLLPAVLLPESRAVFLSLGIVGVGALWVYSRVLGGAATILGIGIACWAVGWSSNVERLQFWQDTWRVLDFWGHGYGSYYVWQPTLNTFEAYRNYRSEHAHNEYLEIWFELGAVGGVLVAAITLATWRRIWTVPGAMLVYMAVLSCFAFPWRMQVTPFVGMFALGAVFCQRPDLERILAQSRAYLRHCFRTARQKLWSVA